MAFASQCEGTSTITENIFENRFMHVNELIRMGANITVSGRTATVRGKSDLQVRSRHVLRPPRLRRPCSGRNGSRFGESILDRVYHMDRGYERLEEKLRGVGAQIRRMGDVFGKK